MVETRVGRVMPQPGACLVGVPACGECVTGGTQRMLLLIS